MALLISFGKLQHVHKLLVFVRGPARPAEQRREQARVVLGPVGLVESGVQHLDLVAGPRADNMVARQQVLAGRTVAGGRGRQVSIFF